MNSIILPHGGYRKLAAFKTANLIYDATAAFCDRYIDRRSRTHDQMVQAARSGVQNIAEGSQASATSKKTELKLTNVAKASLEELLLDYEAFLRQNNLPLWDKNDEATSIVKKARPENMEQLRDLMGKLVSDRSDKSDASDKEAIKKQVAANVMICLINQSTYLLGRLLSKLESDFIENGGVTERMYRVRKNRF